jgi:hypothetical protein
MGNGDWALGIRWGNPAPSSPSPSPPPPLPHSPQPHVIKPRKVDNKQHELWVKNLKIIRISILILQSNDYAPP